MEPSPRCYCETQVLYLRGHLPEMKVWTADLESTSLAARYHRILDRVAESARKVGRSPESIALVAISKNVEQARIQEAYELGIRDFGESRVQEATPKQSAFSNLPLRWHFIGHLQTNKVKRVVGDFLLIHSVDSFKLAEALNREAETLGLVQAILLQVNVSGESSKFGLTPQETPAAVDRIARELSGLRVTGLMTMAPHSANPEAARPFFRRLRQLHEQVSLSHPLEHLSMGMTQDYPVAVEEGATLIRVGTGLFGARVGATGDLTESPAP